MKRIEPIMEARVRELRKNQTPAESILWQHLRSRNSNRLKFRRQYPLGNFIVDFVCLNARLVVEIDGDTHAEQQAYDAARTAYLNSIGYRVIRFTNIDVKESLDAVVENILDACVRINPA